MPARVDLLLLLLLALPGCATPSLDRAEVLRIDPERYRLAFNAAEEAARAEGMTPAIRDRRGGVLETEAGRAPTLLEPWRWTGQSYRELSAATFNHARRRARFEFIRATEREAPTGEMPAPDLLAETGPPQDLLQPEGPLELRVWVTVERQHDPGVRRDAWSRSLTSRAVLEAGNGARDDGSGPFWVPVARDRYTEQRLLAAVASALESPADAVEADADGDPPDHDGR